MLSAVALADLVCDRPASDWAAELDRWCQANMRPWFDDHVEMDAALLDRWHGVPLDLNRRLPVDLLAAIGDAEPSLVPQLAPYHLMAATSASLDPLRPRAHEIYASGWRPPELPGPSHADLVAAISAAKARLDLAAYPLLTPTCQRGSLLWRRRTLTSRQGLWMTETLSTESVKGDRFEPTS